jgi:hypothetical protein
MPKDACEFLETVRHKQRGFWLTIFAWWVCMVVFVFVVSGLFKGAPDALLQVVFYGSALLLYIPAYSLFKLKCPYCNGSAGALPFLRYRFMYCRTCGERIECSSKSPS